MRQVRGVAFLDVASILGNFAAFTASESLSLRSSLELYPGTPANPSLHFFA
jgi:hypothetical protein